MNIQAIVDDDFGNFIKSEAKKLNLSISSYIKFSLKELYDMKRSAEADAALEEGNYDVYSGEEYLAKIKGMIDDA